MCFGGSSPHIPTPPPPTAPPQQSAADIAPLRIGSGQDQNTMNAFGRQALKIALNVPTASGLATPS